MRKFFLMGRNNYFRFKQFTVIQEQAAMKVGTDGVILGAWTAVEDCQKILDVGTGTGLIALMLAQRSNAKITAIEIEENAAAEANENVENSPWMNRIEVLNISFQEFALTATNKYDLIVSNPPFFTNNFKTDCNKRNLARHNDSLPFSELIICSAELLNTNGRLAVILPVEQAKELENLACETGLYIVRKTEIKPNSIKAVNRILMEFSNKETAFVENCLTVYNENGSEYSEAHINLTKDFYLRF